LGAKWRRGLKSRLAILKPAFAGYRGRTKPFRAIVTGYFRRFWLKAHVPTSGCPAFVDGCGSKGHRVFPAGAPPTTPMSERANRSLVDLSLARSSVQKNGCGMASPSPDRGAETALSRGIGTAEGSRAVLLLYGTAAGYAGSRENSSPVFGGRVFRGRAFQQKSGAVDWSHRIFRRAKSLINAGVFRENDEGGPIWDRPRDAMASWRW